MYVEYFQIATANKQRFRSKYELWTETELIMKVAKEQVGRRCEF